MSIELVDIEVFIPDLLAELPACPIPALERRLRDAVIEACERAPIWREQLPEIPVAELQREFDVPDPAGEAWTHNILRVFLNGAALSNVPVADTSDNVYNVVPNRRVGYSVPKRGKILLGGDPNQASSPFAGDISGLTPPTPVPPFTEVDPGPVDPGAPATFRTTGNPIFGTGAFADVDFTNNDLTVTFNKTSGTNVILMDYQPDAEMNDLTSGKYIWNVIVDEPTAQFPGVQIGVGDQDGFFSVNGLGWTAEGVGYDCGTGNIQYTDGSVQTIATGSPAAAGQVVTVKLDIDLMTCEWLLDDVSLTVFDLNLMGIVPSDWSPMMGMKGAGVGNPFMTATMEFDEPDVIARLGALPAGFQTFGTPAVTQQQVDDYNAALAAYNAALAQFAIDQAAYDAAVAAASEDRDVLGLEVYVSVKPTREANRIPLCLYDDYYQLIIDGTLGYAFDMRDTPWFDADEAQRRKVAFEFEIAKAKQGLDQGFSDRPIRVRPRRF